MGDSEEAGRVGVVLPPPPAAGEGKTIELVENWYLDLYCNNTENDPGIVGPVGERPLHVCALSAFRFEQVDFEGAGNYLSDGISGKDR